MALLQRCSRCAQSLWKLNATIRWKKVSLLTQHRAHTILGINLQEEFGGCARGDDLCAKFVDVPKVNS